MQISKPSSEEFPRSEVKENLTWTPQRSLHAKQIELNLLTPLLMCCVHIYRDTFVNFTVGNTNIKNHVRISAHSCKLHAFGRKKRDNSSICWTQWVNALQQLRNIIQI